MFEWENCIFFIYTPINTNRKNIIFEGLPKSFDFKQHLNALTPLVISKMAEKTFVPSVLKIKE